MYVYISIFEYIVRYTPQKNKQKLKVQKDRRRKHKTMNKISKSSKNIRYDDMIEPM